MCHCKWSTGLPVLVTTALLSGCASQRSPHSLRSQIGESVVLVSEAPASLAFAPLLSHPVRVRNTYRDGLPGTIHYKLGRDYLSHTALRHRSPAGIRKRGFHRSAEAIDAELG